MMLHACMLSGNVSRYEGSWLPLLGRTPDGSPITGHATVEKPGTRNPVLDNDTLNQVLATWSLVPVTRHQGARYLVPVSSCLTTQPSNQNLIFLTPTHLLQVVAKSSRTKWSWAHILFKFGAG